MCFSTTKSHIANTMASLKLQKKIFLENFILCHGEVKSKNPSNYKRLIAIINNN